MDFLGLLCKFLIEYTMHGMIASILSSRSEHDVPKICRSHSVTHGFPAGVVEEDGRGYDTTPRWLGK